MPNYTDNDDLIDTSITEIYESLQSIRKIFSDRNPELLVERLSTLPFCTDYIAGKPEVAETGPVWQYWAQGYEQAPAIVQRCISSVKFHTADRQYILLNEHNIHEYVQIPSFITNKIHSMSQTQFSDVLRLYLLAIHGGTWIDATIYMTSPIPQAVTTAPIFFFSRNSDPFLISSWFINAAKNHPIITSLLHAQLKYYSLFDQPSHYFMFHFMFEALITCHDYLAKMHHDMPYLSADAPHALQYLLDQDYDKTAYEAAIESSWAHKLTHKYKPRADAYTHWHHFFDT